MARKQKSREVAPNSPRGGRERVNLDRDNIELDSPYRRRSVRDFTSASTNVWNLVIILVIIGLIATVVFADCNSKRKDGVISYFSPAVFLKNLSSERVIIPGGEYIVDFPVQLADAFQPLYSFGSVRGYVYVNDMRIGSVNKLNFIQSVRREPLLFRIGGETYYAYWEYFETLDRDAYVLKLPDTVYDIDSFPDIGFVIDEWRNVKGSTVVDCVRYTAVYIGDFFAYVGNTLQSFLPWNSVVNVSSVEFNLDDLWDIAEERNGY